MAYGQTGTGKTYTLGRLGEEDTAARGIMVRAMEDILADISLETDSVSVSFMQVVGLLKQMLSFLIIVFLLGNFSHYYLFNVFVIFCGFDFVFDHGRCMF